MLKKIKHLYDKMSYIDPEDKDRIVIIEEAIKEIQNLKEIKEEINASLEYMVNNEENRILFHSIGLSSPVMQWAKDLNGVYTYANKALAQHLFGTDDPNDIIGKDDSQIGAEVIKKYPKWTFGSICMGTDQMTLDLDKPMKFYEWGIIKEDFQYVTAFKNTYKDKDSNIIGSCGLAIYVTDEVNSILDIIETCKDKSTIKKLKKYLKKYGFECDNMFTDQNIENLWEKR